MKGPYRDVMYRIQQIIEAYAIAGIDRDALNAAQRRFVDKIVILLIQKCNREDKPIANAADALKQISDAVRDDPLFN